MVSPEVWGPALWRAFHMIALGYQGTPENADTYRVYYKLFGKVIPCGRCRENYSRHLIEHPIEKNLGSMEDLFAWTVSVHNIVNSQNGKPILTLEQAMDIYIHDIPNHQNGNENLSNVNVTNVNGNLSNGNVTNGNENETSAKRRNDWAVVLVGVLSVLVIVLLLLIYYMYFRSN